MVLGGEAFRVIRSQGWTPHKQDSGPYKEIQRAPSPSSTMLKNLGEHQLAECKQAFNQILNLLLL